MNLLAFLAAAIQLGAPAPPGPAPSDSPPSVTAPPPVAAWIALPELRYRRRLPPPGTMAAFVRAEVAAQRCPLASDALSVPVDLILFVAPSGLIRRIVPRAIDCPTVEQFAAGLALRMARDNLILADGVADAWYRTRIVFPLK